MTEPDFRKTYCSGQKCQKYAGKTGFLAFSRDFIISFFWFFAQRCVLMFKTWPSPIFEKSIFPAENAGICLKSPFLQIFIGLFPYISWFFHTKTLMISLFRSFARSFSCALARSFVLSLSGRSNQHVACFIICLYV